VDCAMISSFGVLDIEAANISLIAPGFNTLTRPNMELALKKQRRDLSFGCFIACSFRMFSQPQGA
jgi:hypothetical protein